MKDLIYYSKLPHHGVKFPVILLFSIVLINSANVYSQSCYCYTTTHLDHRSIDEFLDSQGNNTQFLSHVFQGDFYASSPDRWGVQSQLYDVFNNLYPKQSSWIQTGKTALWCYNTENEALAKRRQVRGSISRDGWTVIDFRFKYISD